MSPEIIGLLMVAAMLLAISIGFPIAFTLLFLGAVFGYWGFGPLVFYLLTLQFNATMMEQTLAAVPLFVFMGIMMEQANLMERLFDSVQKLLAGVRGSLFLAVMFVATIFAAATGIVGASVTILGIMAGKPMIRSGYDVKLSSGLIAAGGTLGILIPPSIMLVVMGPVLEVPVTSLFAAAILPGSAGGVVHHLCDGHDAGSILPSGRPARRSFRDEPGRRFGTSFFLGLVPPAALVMCGARIDRIRLCDANRGRGLRSRRCSPVVARPTAASRANLKEALIKTLEISVLILFLVAASNFFGAVFARLGTAAMLTRHCSASISTDTFRSASSWLLIFLLGWPLEWVPIVLIVVPFLLPLVRKLGFDMTWFGILVAVNLQTAWLSPPVALSAYFLKGVVPQWELSDIYKGMLQFMVLQVIGLILIIAFPEIALWLPRAIYGE